MMKLLLLVLAVGVQGQTHVIPDDLGNLGLKISESRDTSIIKHKKGSQPILRLEGDQRGLVIDLQNKKAPGLLIQSGAAETTISSSAVSVGMPQAPNLPNRETAGAYFKMEGAKLSGTYYFAVEPKTTSFGIYKETDSGSEAVLVLAADGPCGSATSTPC